MLGNFLYLCYKIYMRRHPSTLQQIELQAWSSEQGRRQTEVQIGELSLPDKGFHLFKDPNEYNQFLGAITIGKGVASQLAEDHGPENGFAVKHQSFESYEHPFRYGFLLFGAASREIANLYFGSFAQHMNGALDNVGASFRLQMPSDYQQ
jgi:hypothetical protein